MSQDHNEQRYTHSALLADMLRPHIRNPYTCVTPYPTCRNRLCIGLPERLAPTCSARFVPCLLTCCDHMPTLNPQYDTTHLPRTPLRWPS
jgi:hypothetical protein